MPPCGASILEACHGHVEMAKLLLQAHSGVIINQTGVMRTSHQRSSPTVTRLLYVDAAEKETTTIASRPRLAVPSCVLAAHSWIQLDGVAMQLTWRTLDGVRQARPGAVCQQQLHRLHVAMACLHTAPPYWRPVMAMWRWRSCCRRTRLSWPARRVQQRVFNL